MSKHKNLKRNLLICLLAGSAVMYTLPLHAATSVIGNNTLPTGENSLTHNHTFDRGNLEMTITQSGSNGIIKWDSFDVGGSATVNFRGDAGGYNVLNYVNGANASQIYGTINANNNGNIFIVNPAGVQIGNSAQINVGSLYVSNQNLDTVDWSSISANTDVNTFLNQYDTHTNAELMSLGNINITNVKNGNVTFEGNGRIVIDTERIKKNDVVTDNFIVKTDDVNDVLLGYDAYNTGAKKDTYAGKDKTFNDNVLVNGQKPKEDVKGYMWVEDVNQLQAINTNLSGNYALRNSIDATSTEQNDFTSIGSVNDGFKGKFDGIDYNIFNLNINGENNVGLFGQTSNATISNVTMVGGSINGKDNVGAVVGNANNTTITNVTNSAAVNGQQNVGGIVGNANNTLVQDAINTGTIEGKDANTGNAIVESNVGGLIGNMSGDSQNESRLEGNSYNLGAVTGDGANVGGLVGYAVNSTIGDGTNLVYNRLDVKGAYNVGGIVGNMQGTTVQNAENSGNVTATRYTTETYYYHAGQKNNNTINAIVKNETVNVANVGGIAGKADNTDTKESIIKDVTNTGNVSSSKQNGNDYYDAGNVGGIVGSAVDTNISNATNKENEVRGAHNVGGVAGYFGNSNDDKEDPDYTINEGINDGGDIMATGARNGTEFVTEKIRPGDVGAEVTIIGNMGGIVGYLDGDNVHVTSSGNRGTVHSLDITGDTVSHASQASNTGGVVGKIDRSDTLALKDDEGNIIFNVADSAVSNSYNTGDVRGYMGVGGVVGMMYNGEVAGSYNLGSVNTTRRAQDADENNFPSVNMGGVVGDTTEQTNAKALIYDVYNKGQIGDETYQFYARHVGGVVGRLSGTVEKAYNTGAIYNGYNVVGGIAGWFYKGTINNSFNTGNITVVNNEEGTSTTGSQVGGIVGGAGVYSGEDSKISNAYNLGTIRSFKGKGSKDNSIGGIVGGVVTHGGDNKNLIIENVYTTGNLYAGNQDGSSTTDGLGSIYGNGADGKHLQISNAYYIRPDKKSNLPFADLEENNKDNSNKAIAFGDKDKISSYQYDEIVNNQTIHHSLTFTQQAGGDVDGGKYNDGQDSVKVSDDNWRIYDGNTPILNAFLPDSEKYFSDELKDNNGKFKGTIQYGTAYDPLLTIINTDRDLVFNFGTGEKELNITNAAGIAVYGGGLTFKNFDTSSGTGYFGGTIYADGALNLNGSNDIGLGSAAQIYGSAVNITTDGQLTIYGDVTATGNTANGAKGDKEYDKLFPNAPDTITVTDAGHISINAGDVDVYGTLTSATNGEVVNIPGIEDEAVTWTPGEVDNPYAAMSDIADRFAHQVTSSATGDININAGTKLVVDEDGTPILDENDNKQYIEIGNGNVNLYFGNKEEGLITTGGNLTVSGTGDVYVDSDLDIKGNMTLTSTGKDSEVLLTLTNIGKVQADRVMNVIEEAINGVDLSVDNLSDIIFNAVDASGVDNKFNKADADKVAEYLKNYSNNKIQALEQLNDDISVAYMHDFMHSFGEGNDNYIALNAASGDAKLSVDMWVENSDGSGSFNFNKYDYNLTGLGEDHTFIDELEALKFYVNEKDIGNKDKIADASKYVYVEVHNGEQLKGIQNYVKSGVENASDALGFNYALMGDINASDVENYEAIGTGSEFTGTFDGRGNRIIGLNVNATDKVNNKTNAGIFSTIGNGGTVKNVNIYSGNFTGTETAGAIAGTNNGRIENVVTFGNTVTSNGNAGGIVGINNSGEFKGNNLTGGIYNVESTGSVIAGQNSIAGGLVGKNNGGIDYSTSDSAVTAAAGTNAGLGGVVGVNGENGVVHYVDSLGVTNGGDTNSSNIGGIIGINNGNMYSGYNESIVTGNDNVGGIIGTNEGIYNENDKKWTTGTVENVVNATSVTSEAADSENIGGLVGTNIGSVTNGRNNGTITGNTNVGGLVGNNGEDAVLTDLVNAEAADITGIINVGGIAGSNAGEITTGNVNTDEEVNLINRGSITGQQYVGGVAGSNSGTITNANNDVELNVKDSTATGDDAAKYFGGIAGVNTGTIKKATNTANVNADGASYVGGIVGQNNGKLEDMAGNSGNVTGKDFVGGVVGENNGNGNNHDPLDKVIASNTGTVIATNGGAGGIFAVNNAGVINSELTNNGVVIGNGTTGTGGIFGVNKGDISKTSLINKIDGQVIGISNVGGLIGVNSGTITGGRNEVQEVDDTGKVTAEKDSYYKYQIYNNGVINVGTWNDADNELTFGGKGTNIGGLIGSNIKETINGVEQTGSLTAGYNTGAINASGSENVGGIVGNNAGTVDQVFNTVMTENGQNQTITGGTNVGGLVGYNEAHGKITNAYNTSNVVATNQDGIVGNLVGTNTGEVKFVYGVANNLIGSGTDAVNGYVIDGSDKWLQEGTYAGFKFGANGWKIYDGSTLPMLSVFLTKVTVVDQHLVDQYFSAKHYGEFHQITADDIKALIAIGAISAPDGFGAFNNNNGLIQGVADDAMANSGNWLYSGQIADSFVNGIFNPNNLGYDISLVYSPFELDNDPSSHWNYLFNDAPFDRNKDFRERKAEVNFVDGGMEI